MLVGEVWRAGFLRPLVGDAGSESEVALGLGLPIEEAVWRRLESEASAPAREVGRSSRRAGTVPLRPDLPVGDWTVLLACCV